MISSLTNLDAIALQWYLAHTNTWYRWTEGGPKLTDFPGGTSPLTIPDAPSKNLPIRQQYTYQRLVFSSHRFPEKLRLKSIAMDKIGTRIVCMDPFPKASDHSRRPVEEPAQRHPARSNVIFQDDFEETSDGKRFPMSIQKCVHRNIVQRKTFPEQRRNTH